MSAVNQFNVPDNAGVGDDLPEGFYLVRLDLRRDLVDLEGDKRVVRVIEARLQGGNVMLAYHAHSSNAAFDGQKWIWTHFYFGTNASKLPWELISEVIRPVPNEEICEGSNRGVLEGESLALALRGEAAIGIDRMIPRKTRAIS